MSQAVPLRGYRLYRVRQGPTPASRDALEAVGSFLCLVMLLAFLVLASIWAYGVFGGR